ncbi:DNA mismatch repair protein [Tritrichomonas musculus]|uniref:DNA mismatch repair protein n=1 Tax=Tritrichomonas musculus TaxID=1915356 RepID=A0ABR2KVV5_9EUKA
MEISPEIAIPNHFSIASELIMNSIDSGASQITISYDLYHNIISCKDNSPGIPHNIFQQILSSNQSKFGEVKNLIFQRNIGYLKLISQISDVDIQTKTEEDKIPRRITKGKPQIFSPLLSIGTEIIISSIFINNRIKLDQISNPKNKNESIYKLKNFINTISLSFVGIKFVLNNYVISSSKSFEERWRVISGTFLKISTDNHITYLKCSFNLGLQLPFSPFMINKFPVTRLIIDGYEMKPIKNCITVISNKAMYGTKKIYWSNDGLVYELTTLKRKSLSTYQTYVGNKEISQMKVIGTFLNSYIICYNGDILYAIDQHAAHERINLEKLLDSITDPFPSQELKLPLKLPLDPNYEIPTSVIKMAKRWGWTVSKTCISNNNNDCRFQSQKNLFSSTQSSLSWVLFSIPKVETYLVDDVEGFLSYINKIEKNEIICGSNSNNNEENDSLIAQIPECLMHALQTRACKKSIKFGDVISDERAQNLIIELSKCKRPNYCAHGRTVAAPLINLSNKFIRYTHI